MTQLVSSENLLFVQQQQKVLRDIFSDAIKKIGPPDIDTTVTSKSRMLKLNAVRWERKENEMFIVKVCLMQGSTTIAWIEKKNVSQATAVHSALQETLDVINRTIDDIVC